MEYKQIQELIKAINKSNISELSIEEGDFKITIKQAQSVSETQFVAVQAPPMHTMQMPQAAPQPAMIPAAQTATAPSSANGNDQAAPASSDKLVTIKSPMIGTFYRSPGPDKPAYVNVGDDIKSGQPLCTIEAMKLFNELESEMSGRIVKVLVEDASPVEYDQPLFLVDPA
jgi:acetyl-CoA carboxylase biotin carboxyl carrier protein